MLVIASGCGLWRLLTNIGRLAKLCGVVPVLDGQVPCPIGNFFFGSGSRLICAKTSQLYQLIIGQHCLSSAAMLRQLQNSRFDVDQGLWRPGSVGADHPELRQKTIGDEACCAVQRNGPHVCFGSKADIEVECALAGGQFQAAVLTGCWACRSSYCTGLK